MGGSLMVHVFDGVLVGGRTAPPRPVAMHMPAAPSQAAVLGCWMELSDGCVKGV